MLILTFGYQPPNQLGIIITILSILIHSHTYITLKVESFSKVSNSVTNQILIKFGNEFKNQNPSTEKSRS